MRSRDMAMPEGINRLCTDVLCDYLFTTDRLANENLKAEGIAEEKIIFVGNVMIDMLMSHKDMAKELAIASEVGVHSDYAAVTLHRPSNVDDKSALEEILQALNAISVQLPFIFPMHPRTRKMISYF